jgi:hypothetical protein
MRWFGLKGYCLKVGIEWFAVGGCLVDFSSLDTVTGSKVDRKLQINVAFLVFCPQGEIVRGLEESLEPLIDRL